MDKKNDILRQLPKIDKLTSDSRFKGLNSELIKICARNVLDDIRNSETPETDINKIYNRIETEYKKLLKGSLFKVINATGVPIHTNLGRSPVPKDILDEISDVVCGYSNLEYNTANGKRGDRYHHAANYLKILTGAEDAVIVNNNASAVFLILNTFSKNRETIVSRGELVEIGGSFRIPDVMKGSGAKLCEVGTTNKTRIKDYLDAASPKTAMMMKVHKSNYEIVGFSEEAGLEEVAEAAAETGVISYYDAGSGLFIKSVSDSVCDDITIPQVMKKGFDLISFSGDKMLGGCQAGIIIGKKELIAKLKKNQLMRMLRVDKITLAVLQSVFRKYLEGSGGNLPVNSMLKNRDLKAKAEKLSLMIGKNTEVISVKSTIGGGSCPASEIDSYAVALITGIKPQTVEKRLRGFATPVVARIIDDKTVLDVRTIDESEFETVKKAVEEAL